ncbi:MAG TPA: VacJ family lipoprotein [Stellaceae bacterium]|nr:VacJ family lipoprotein [Stellaceae bacterium]
MPVSRLTLVLPGLLVAGLAISGCAAPAASGGPQTAQASEGFIDPYEDTNRSIFEFNQGVDRNVLVPVSKAYRTVVPPPMRQSLHDFMQNLNGPVILVNDVLQGQLGLAGNTLARLVVNTTVGVGGMFDVATRVGIPYHSNDLGVTLATWGFADGPYIMLPVLGPSTARDTVGMVGDSFADPGDYVAGQNHYLWAAVARSAVSGVDERSRNIETLADIEKTSLDYYATIRSLYRQRRQAQIRHEKSDLPNPSPVMGGDSGPEPVMSYSVAPPPASKEAPAK